MMLFSPAASFASKWAASSHDTFALANSFDSTDTHLVSIGFYYQNCDNTVLQIVDTISNPNETSVGREDTVILRIDWLEAWSTTFKVDKVPLGDKIYPSFVIKVNAELIGELVKGSNLRVKVGDVIMRWSLKGSALALSQAYQLCIQEADSNEKYFKLPPKQKSKSDDEQYF